MLWSQPSFWVAFLLGEREGRSEPASWGATSPKLQNQPLLWRAGLGSGQVEGRVEALPQVPRHDPHQGPAVLRGQLAAGPALDPGDNIMS